jgi:hypothetical protein
VNFKALQAEESEFGSKNRISIIMIAAQITSPADSEPRCESDKLVRDDDCDFVKLPGPGIRVFKPGPGPGKT